MASFNSDRTPSFSASQSRSTNGINHPLCFHNAVAPLRTVKVDGPTFGRKFFGCSYWPKTCGFFKWADVADDIPELQFQLFEKDTTILQLECEKDDLQRTIHIHKKKIWKLQEELAQEKKVVNGDKKLGLLLLLSWVLFVFVLLMK